MSDLLAALEKLRARLGDVPQLDARRLEEVKIEILGRKAGALTEILKRLPTLDAETQIGRAHV